MDMANLTGVLFWPILKIVVLVLLGGIVIGFFVGIITYGRPRKRRKGSTETIEDAIEIGVDLSHLLIDFFLGKRKSDRGIGSPSHQNTLLSLRGLRPSEFEEFVAGMFTKLGYRTQVTGGSGDGGIDIEMNKGGRHYVVQCKKFITSKVSPRDVRDFFGAMVDRNVDGKGFIITTSIFTTDAEQFAEGKPIELIDGNKLVEYVRQSGMEPDIPTTTSPRLTTCPKCGSKLITRQNRYTGNPFLGCSNYPKCKFTAEV